VGLSERKIEESQKSVREVTVAFQKKVDRFGIETKREIVFF
jgi:hypothetical protein